MEKNMLPLCRKLAIRKLMESKVQSICMIVSVILTTILFTAVFSAVFYFQDSIRKAQMESASWTAHGLVSEVTDDQYLAMLQSNVVSDISYYMHLGFLKEEVQDEVVEIEYSEDTIARWMYFGLAWGRMPQGKYEVALSQELLNSKGIPSDSFGEGAPIHLRYEVNGNVREGDFIVSGAYEQKPTSSEVLFVSQEFFEEAILETAGEEKRDSMLGERVVEVMFPSTSHMERNMELFLDQAGVQENRWFLNPAYSSMEIEPGIVAAVVFVLFLIMSCAYFIISNIFHISVMQDTRFYGSLATLGFKKGEIRRIVQIKSDVLCAISIPVGLALGLVLSSGFLPKVMAPFMEIDVQEIPGLLMFVFAAAFAYLTVCISSRRPAHMASEMLPVEAKRYVSVKAGKKKISRNGHKIRMMAWKNVTRERKKSILIICSIMVCIVLASFFYTVARGLDLDIFLKSSIKNDFIVGGSNYFNRLRSFPTAIDNSLLQALGQEDGIETSGGACVDIMNVPMDGRTYKKYQELAGEYDEYQDGIMHSTVVYGLDDYIFNQVTVTEGTLDMDKLKTGNYIVVSGFVQSQNDESCYKPGDKLKLSFNEKVVEYIVMAVAKLPYDYSVRFRYPVSVELYLPSREWMRQMQSQDYYMYAYDVQEDYSSHWEKLMSDMAGSGRAFTYQSKTTFRKQFEGFSEGFLVLGIAVSGILGIIGLMNFINVVYSSIYDRRHELAVMQSMGMGLKQVYGMLMEEGGYYMLGAWIGSIILSLPVGYYLMASLTEMEFFKYHFYPQPFLIFGIAGCLVAACVPCMIFHMINKKEGLLYRLRLGTK